MSIPEGELRSTEKAGERSTCPFVAEKSVSKSIIGFQEIGMYAFRVFNFLGKAFLFLHFRLGFCTYIDISIFIFHFIITGNVYVS